MVPPVTGIGLLWVAIAGVFFGLVAVLHIEVISMTEKWIRRIPAGPYVKAFGGGVASYAAIACIISFTISGHGSVFPSQILARPKSPVFGVSDQGLPVDMHVMKMNLASTNIQSLLAGARGFWERQFFFRRDSGEKNDQTKRKDQRGE